MRASEARRTLAILHGDAIVRADLLDAVRASGREIDVLGFATVEALIGHLLREGPADLLIFDNALSLPDDIRRQFAQIVPIAFDDASIRAKERAGRGDVVPIPIRDDILARILDDLFGQISRNGPA